MFETLTELWLEDDHYKWRAMRLAGVEERLVTGDADPWERFAAWAETVPGLIRNPLYLWTHLELRRVFGIDLPLGPATAREIWEEANRQLPRLSARALLERFDVATVIATTDDPADDLAAHGGSADGARGDDPDLPARRRACAARRPARLECLGRPPRGSSGDGRGSRVAARRADPRARAVRGGRAGARATTASRAFPTSTATRRSPTRRCARARAGDGGRRSAGTPSCSRCSRSRRPARRGRRRRPAAAPRARSATSRPGFGPVGPDAGADAVGDQRQGPGLVRFLGVARARRRLAPHGPLQLEPGRRHALRHDRRGVLAAGRLVQWGPPWWFNDHEDGMRRQLDVLSRTGRLAGFVGMVTDSRSLLSMTRHELFRRILCDTIGRDVDAGPDPGRPRAPRRDRARRLPRQRDAVVRVCRDR